MPVDLIEDFDNEYSFVGNDGPSSTSRPISRRRAAGSSPSTRASRSARTGRRSFPRRRRACSGVGLVGNLFVANYLKDAQTQVKLFEPDGTFVREVELPGIGTATGFGGKRTDTETFYTFSSFATPPSIYRYDLVTGKSKLIRRAEGEVQPGRLRGQAGLLHEQGRHQGADVHHGARRASKLDGSNPTLLYGYGGFNISLTPAFSIARAAWLEMGGVYAVANLRGGGEYGQDWHKAGTKLHKQNVFDDFIAAAEYLIKREVHAARQAGHPGRQQRRPARRRGHDAAAGPVRRLPAGASASWTCCASTSSPPAASGSTTTARRTIRRSSRRCTPTRRITTLKNGSRSIRRRW